MCIQNVLCIKETSSHVRNVPLVWILFCPGVPGNILKLDSESEIFSGMAGEERRWQQGAIFFLGGLFTRLPPITVTQYLRNNRAGWEYAFFFSRVKKGMCQLLVA